MTWAKWMKKAALLLATSLLVAPSLAGMAGCGGANEDDLEQITGEPPSLSEPAALDRRTDASRISFQAGTENLFLEMIDENGFCLINATTPIVAIVGDFQGRAVEAEVPIAFFIARGRGIIDAQIETSEEGLAEATFRSLCPPNFRDPIVLVAAVRGAEPFTDLNSNGRHDEGEPFVDLEREAFLDANQNGVFEPQLNEFMIWDPNRNGTFEPGGNGRYDRDNIIVDEAFVIPTQLGVAATPDVSHVFAQATAASILSAPPVQS